MLLTAERANNGSSRLSRLIEWINGHDGVEWCTFAEMA